MLSLDYSDFQYFVDCYAGWCYVELSNGLLEKPKEEAYAPNTEDMIPTQGLASGLFGRRTRSFGSGGRRGAMLTFGVALGGIFVFLQSWFTLRLVDIRFLIVQGRRAVLRFVLSAIMEDVAGGAGSCYCGTFGVWRPE